MDNVHQIQRLTTKEELKSVSTQVLYFVRNFMGPFKYDSITNGDIKDSNGKLFLTSSNLVAQIQYGGDTAVFNEMLAEAITDYWNKCNNYVGYNEWRGKEGSLVVIERSIKSDLVGSIHFLTQVTDDGLDLSSIGKVNPSTVRVASEKEREHYFKKMMESMVSGETDMNKLLPKLMFS